MYKTDNQKLLIDIFNNNRNKSFSAISLIDELKDKMNKATIYRQLQNLESKNIIKKNYNEVENSYEYQYFLDCNNHFHMKCCKCGKIIHLNIDDAKEFINNIEKIYDFNIDVSLITLYGNCKECE
ncbi:MAG: Fur family transcriptional regulator [Anaeroplasma sp.]